MTCGGLADFYFSGEVTHTEVATLQQRIDDPQTTGIGQELEPIRQELSLLDSQPAVIRSEGRSPGVRSRHLLTLLAMTYEYKLICSDIDTRAQQARVEYTSTCGWHIRDPGRLAKDE